ncbi:hypothetical protein JCM11251_000462 [Rhodosporidiobolus azoricus]
MAAKDQGDLPSGCQLYPLKQYNVLPGPFQRNVLDPSFYTYSSAPPGELVAPLDPSKPFVVYHKDFLRIVGQNPTLDIIASNEVGEGGDGYPLFHEAGVWIEETKEVIFTSNCNPEFRNLLGRIRLDALDGPSPQTLSTSWDLLHPAPSAPSLPPSVVASNGATLYRVGGKDHLLVCCQGTAEIPSNLSVVDPLTGASYPTLNNFHGRPFNAINDVVVLPPLAPVGREDEDPDTSRTDLHDDPLTTIWFTDPTYASAQGYKGKPQMPCQVYCFTPATGDVRVVADGFSMPNGICFSPSGSHCYITDTGMVPGDGSIEPSRPGTIYVYDVVRPRPGEIDPRTEKEVDLTAVQPRLENRKVFAFVDSGLPDGIKCDREGNVYSGTGEGVSVWNPHGTLLGKIVLFPSSSPSSPPALPSSLPRDFTNPAFKTRYCANFNFCPRGRLCILAEDRIYVAQLNRGEEGGKGAVEGALLPAVKEPK